MGLNQSDTGKREFTENQPNANSVLLNFLTQIFLRVGSNSHVQISFKFTHLKFLKYQRFSIYSCLF